MSEGERLKEEGIAKISAVPQAAPWRAVATQRLLELAAAGDPFTSEDITDVAGQPGHPNSVGALFSGAARRGWVRRLGFVAAERPNQHAALISQWEGTGAAPAPLKRTGPALIDPSITVTNGPTYKEVGTFTAAPNWPRPLGWQCQRGGCHAIRQDEPEIVTISPDIRIGLCPSCGKRTAHRRVT